ncbi:hypothetical protein VPH35_024757 [Triticum aestivum]|uniref:uncharacterized protein n=1 Tax=Triticum aestivum TaxID=4565 RepID=UPI001D020049|nr:uncharacterized protein LOC123191079 [Triticum aestivum]
MVAAAPRATRRSFRDSLEADIQRANSLALPQGVGLFAGLRRGVPADAHVLQPRRAPLPLPPAVDRLQPRRRPQDPHLGQGLRGRHHNHLSTHERKPSTKEFFLRCDASLPRATGARDQRHR